MVDAFFSQLLLVSGLVMIFMYSASICIGGLFVSWLVGPLICNRFFGILSSVRLFFLWATTRGFFPDSFLPICPFESGCK